MLSKVGVVAGAIGEVRKGTDSVVEFFSEARPLIDA